MPDHRDPIARVVSWLMPPPPEPAAAAAAVDVPPDYEKLREELEHTLRRVDGLEEDLRTVSARAGTLRDERDKVREQRDKAREQRDKAREQRDTIQDRLAHTKADLELFKRQRDEARKQRDEARLERDEMLLASGKVPQGMKQLQELHREWPKRHFRLGDQIEELFRREGISGGKLLEIGGRDHPYRERFSQFDYVHLDIDAETGPGVMEGDITHCPQIPDASFDVIISVDVFEHIDRPWKAAQEIVRLLKPGGITYHSTLFSWRYHPCPIDFWRFTPDALRFLFRDLEHVVSGFDDLERRRNILGVEPTRIEPDAFGGWRENWRVYYVGRKPAQLPG